MDPSAPAGIPATDGLPDKFAALSHPTRIAILLQLAGGKACCKEVVDRLDLAQSTVSQHLATLVKAGLVSHAADRQRSIYSVNARALAELADGATALARSCCCGQVE